MFDANQFTNRITSSSDPDHEWRVALIGESGRIEYFDLGSVKHDIVDNWGVVHAGFLSRPGLIMSDVEGPLDEYVYGEDRVLINAPNTRLTDSYVTINSPTSNTRHIPDANIDWWFESDQGTRIQEMSLESLDAVVDVYANGRLLFPGIDSSENFRSPDVSIRKNSGALELWFSRQGIGTGSNKMIAVRDADRHSPWTYYSEIDTSETLNHIHTQEFIIHDYTKRITDENSDFQLDTFENRCSMWLVVKRADVSVPLIKLFDTWSITDIDLSRHAITASVDLSNTPNWFAVSGNGLVDLLGENSVDADQDVQAWLVLSDSTVYFEYYLEVDISGKVFDLNLHNQNLSLYSSRDQDRIADEIERAGTCPFIPPPIKRREDLEIWSWSSQSTNHALDARMLNAAEDYTVPRHSALVARSGLIPVIHATGGFVYLREPVQNAKLWCRCAFDAHVNGARTYEPSPNWLDWSSRLFTSDNPPDTTNWNGMIVSGDETAFPFARIDDRVNASCTVAGLYRSVELLEDNPGRIAHANVPVTQNWAQYASDVSVRHDGRYSFYKDLLDGLIQPWSVWQETLDLGAIEFHNQRLNANSDYFPSSDTDQLDTPSDQRPWNAVFDADNYSNDFTLDTHIDSLHSGSFSVRIVQSINVNNLDRVGVSLLVLYASVDYGPWIDIDRHQILADTDQRVVDYEHNGKPVRFRSRLFTLPETRRSPDPGFNDTNMRVNSDVCVWDRDALQSSKIVHYWNRTTEYTLNSDSDNVYDRPDNEYHLRSLQDVYLVAWDRLTSVIIRPDQTPNNPANGDLLDASWLELVYRDYYDEMQEIANDLDEGPADNGSAFTTETQTRAFSTLPQLEFEFASELTPNYTTEMRWYTARTTEFDIWTRESTAHYDARAQWKLRHYFVSINADLLDCGELGDTVHDLYDDGIAHVWNDEIHTDMTDFAIDDHDIDSQETIQFSKLDGGDMPRRVT